MVVTDSPRDAAAEILVNHPFALSPERAARRAALMVVLKKLQPVPDGPDAMQFWSIGTYLAFKPQNAWQDWLGQHVALIMMRINRVERNLQALQSLRAIECWVGDRRLLAEQVVRHLVRHPDQAHGKLPDGPVGCDWLIERREGLAQTPPDRWSEARKTLAALIHPGGADAELAAGFAERRLAILRERRAWLEPADAAPRALVEAGLSSGVLPSLARHRRDVRAWHRLLRWSVGELRTALPDRPDIPQFCPICDAPAVAQEVGTATEQKTQTKPTSPPAAAEPAARNNTQTKPNPSLVAVLEKTQTKPNPALGVELAAPEKDQTKPPELTPAPVGPLKSQTLSRFAALSDSGGAARVAGRKRRIAPGRAVGKIRRAEHRSA